MSRERPGNRTVFRTSRTFSSVGSASSLIVSPPADLMSASRASSRRRADRLAQRLGDRRAIARRAARPTSMGSPMDTNTRAGVTKKPPLRRIRRRCPTIPTGSRGRPDFSAKQRRARLEGQKLPRPRARLLREDDERRSALETRRAPCRATSLPCARSPRSTGTKPAARHGPPEKRACERGSASRESAPPSGAPKRARGCRRSSRGWPR